MHLQGKPVDWVNRAKEDVFSENEGFKHITVQKVSDKYDNFKRAWKSSRALVPQLHRFWTSLGGGAGSEVHLIRSTTLFNHNFLEPHLV